MFLWSDLAVWIYRGEREYDCSFRQILLYGFIEERGVCSFASDSAVLIYRGERNMSVPIVKSCCIDL